MSRGGLLFFRGERIQCLVFCISRSKGGRRASRGLSTKEDLLSTRIFAARLTISLRPFLADHFFRSEKKETPAGHACAQFSTQNPDWIAATQQLNDLTIHKFFHFLNQDLGKVLLWQFFHHLSLFKQDTLSPSSGHPDIRLSGLSRSVYHASHYGHPGG